MHNVFINYVDFNVNYERLRERVNKNTQMNTKTVTLPLSGTVQTVDPTLL